jgi:exodeoxyribonuclease VII small subunit
VATTTEPAQPTTDLPPPTVDVTIDDLPFDEALAQLQRTVAELEAGGQPLEQAIALYERGVALQARCERLIGDAQLRVQQLVARAGGALETRDVMTDDGTDPPIG